MGPQSQRILVAYASRHGATEGIAQAVAKELRTTGVVVDTRWVREVTELSDYDAVIIGSAIRYDKWLPEAAGFVKTHQETLATLPVALFFTCMTLASTSDKAARQAERYAEAISAQLPHVPVTGIGQFAGVLNYRKFPVAGRIIARILFAFLGGKQGDYRDWTAIRNWAKTSISSLN